MPNLAAVEVLVKRRMLIERAHSGGRSAIPVYEGSDFIMGVRESVDGSVVDPSAVRYTAEKLHMESEILKQQRLSLQERRALGLPSHDNTRQLPDVDEKDGGADASGGGGDRGGRRRARGRGGRGDK